MSPLPGASSHPPAVADLLGLQFELDNLQHGIYQLEKMTPKDPFGPSAPLPDESSPFGDSFVPNIVNSNKKPKDIPCIKPPPITTRKLQHSSSNASSASSDKVAGKLHCDNVKKEESSKPGAAHSADSKLSNNGGSDRYAPLSDIHDLTATIFEPPSLNSTIDNINVSHELSDWAQEGNWTTSFADDTNSIVSIYHYFN